MMDNLSAEHRTKAMRANVSGQRKTTEWALRARLIALGFSGWEVGPPDIPGSPDFLFRSARLAVFVDGCFWHGCTEHRSIPRTNREMWRDKIEKNRRRDQEVSLRLSNMGWRVLRIWEHELSSEPAAVVKKIIENLQAAEDDSYPKEMLKEFD